MFEAMYVRYVSAVRPACQRKTGREDCGIFLSHLRPVAFGRGRRGGAVVLFFFDLHFCLVVGGWDPMCQTVWVRLTFSHTPSNCRAIPNQVSVYQWGTVNP